VWQTSLSKNKEGGWLGRNTEAPKDTHLSKQRTKKTNYGRGEMNKLDSAKKNQGKKKS